MSLVTDTFYTGLQYAFLASGSFFAEQGLHDISMAAVQEVFQYNVTTALQVMLDVRYFNSRIGLYKDASNDNITCSALDPSNLKFPIDSINISASDFIAGMQSKNQVMSVGALDGIYTNFNQFVTDYFGNRFGFETIFDASGQSLYNGGVFDASALINIINNQTINPITHEYIKDLSGTITLSNINNCLDYIVYTNKFGNRSNSTDGSGNFLLSTTPYWEPMLDSSGHIIYTDLSNNVYTVQKDGSGLIKDISGNLPTGEIFPNYYSGTLLTDGSGNQVYQDASDTLYYLQSDGSLQTLTGQPLQYGVQTYPAYIGVQLLLDSSNNVVYHDSNYTFYYLNVDGRYLDVSGNPLGVAVQIFPVFTPGPGRPVLDVNNNIVFQPVYSIANGFLENDLIFLPNGFQVTLTLDIINNSIDLNQLGFANVSTYQQQTNVNQQGSQSQGFKSVSTVADDKKITTTINVPLLIKLKNLSNGPIRTSYPTTKADIAKIFI
jgi:hypothetical protein